MPDEEPRVRESRVVHRGRCGVFGVHSLELPGGHVVELELLAHPGASAVIPFLAPGRILLIRQYRFAAGGPIWEIPAGKLDPGEDPQTCARRELAEETGYAAQRWMPLGRILTAPGFTDEIIHLFRAEELTAGPHSREPSELIELHEFSVDEVFAMVRRGEIYDAKTVVALYHACALPHV
jgi:ADP-ribose pyrophosphatase